MLDRAIMNAVQSAMMLSFFRKQKSGQVKKLFGQTALVLVGVLALVWLMLRILEPGPKGRISLAVGGGGGVYAEFAKDLVETARRYGLDIRLRTPPGFDSLEQPARMLVTERLRRGQSRRQQRRQQPKRLPAPFSRPIQSQTAAQQSAVNR